MQNLAWSTVTVYLQGKVSGSWGMYMVLWLGTVEHDMNPALHLGRWDTLKGLSSYFCSSVGHW